METYWYYLINKQGCYFDTTTFQGSETECDRLALKWARGRGGDYWLARDADDGRTEQEIAHWVDGKKQRA